MQGELVVTVIAKISPLWSVYTTVVVVIVLSLPYTMPNSPSRLIIVMADNMIILNITFEISKNVEATIKMEAFRQIKRNKNKLYVDDDSH